ncbi:putative alanine and valine and glycine rich protein [Mycobacterium bohemicum DSM 44277]|uniref:Putative alanine and valine and glycine rich protein n=1 Tax=Mycobacterium bohemicum DSM 44277 TaxID=1236609 RepID=A0A0U0WBN4_MYCBE|nr:TRAM domain-containing protein [Mycobacterium bohemicum]CPR12410.1 putative alanine and valine and glycine rich protein [Mycobacterium bohemicum DSM 44277]
MQDSTARAELTVVAGAPANGGSCVAHHEGRVVFVRYALPGERVRVRVTADRGSYWHAEVVEVIEPSADRIASLCPIAGVDGSGCCDLAFATPEAARAIKADVVANQLQRLGGHQWSGEAQPLSESPGTGWRTRVRLEVGDDGCPGFHRYHSDRLVTDLRCAQLPDGMLDGLDVPGWPPAAQLHVAVDDDGQRHVVRTQRERGRTTTTVVQGGYDGVQRVGARSWRVPVTSFWQAHRDAARVYSALVVDWAQPATGMTVWDLYGGAGVFAADVAVLDPPRAGAGREVIDLLAAASVPRVVHIGCEAASFARDIGLYRGHGYAVEKLSVFDAFPLTHHTECVALLSR